MIDYCNTLMEVFKHMQNPPNLVRSYILDVLHGYMSHPQMLASSSLTVIQISLKVVFGEGEFLFVMFDWLFLSIACRARTLIRNKQASDCPMHFKLSSWSPQSEGLIPRGLCWSFRCYSYWLSCMIERGVQVICNVAGGLLFDTWHFIPHEFLKGIIKCYFKCTKLALLKMLLWTPELSSSRALWSWYSWASPQYPWSNLSLRSCDLTMIAVASWGVLANFIRYLYMSPPSHACRISDQALTFSLGKKWGMKGLGQKMGDEGLRPIKLMLIKFVAFFCPHGEVLERSFVEL